jgi:predicted dehydrogenase
MDQTKQRIRMGMVGGGEGAFIGDVHRKAAQLDGHIELVCGAFSRDAEKNQRSGRSLGLPAERIYDDFKDMMRIEAERPANERMQFVSIVTPNNSHFAIAVAALDAGFAVLSDKPATFSLDEARQLAEKIKSTGHLYGLTHTYAGYPMVKEARFRIDRGDLGSIRKVIVEYPQGWLSNREEDADNKQAAWRLDPAQAGVSSAMGDIGVHAAHLAEYVSGLKMTEICADLSSLVPGRLLDDDGSILLRFDNGARGVLTASQICAGEENNLKLRIYGERGGMEWSQQEPNTLWLKWLDRPAEMLRTGAPGIESPFAQHNTRTPSGHPEGYLEAFANLYNAFAGQIRAKMQDEPASEADRDIPGIEAALRGMHFIELAVKAGNSEQKWHTVADFNQYL